MAAVSTLDPYTDGFKASFAPTPKSLLDPAQALFEEAERLESHPPPLFVDAWPRHLESPMAWTGQSFKDSTTYTYHLSPKEVAEIDNGLKHFQALGLWGDRINPQTFPLPTLSTKLAALAQEVHSGRGFVNIRGLEPGRYSPEDTSLVFVGLSKYIGNRIGKQDEGYALGHIREARRSETAPGNRPFRDSNLALTYHTDGYCPILGMQMRAEAAEGGDHLLASAWRIYNELAATRPDIIRTLATPNWHFDPRGIQNDPRPRALFYYEGESRPGAGDGKLITNFIRYLLTGRPGVPKLETSPDCTPEQIDALDAVEAVARNHALTLDVRPGDIVFVNNWSMLHSRTAFRDDDEHTRHLVRIWLKNDSPALEWPMPAVFRMGHAKLFDEENTLRWNVTPQPRLAFKIYQTLAQL